jgi:hypothetical protein
MNNANNNARIAVIANAARKIAQRELNTQTETLECLRAEDVRDCFNFVAESLHDETAE